MKRFFLIIFTTSFLLIALSASATAQIGSGMGIGGSGDACPVTERFSNFGTFIQYGLSYSDWAENWNDIFHRNACQRDDILVLQARLDKVRTQIRKNIFSCNTSALSPLTTLEIRLQTELEYLRRILDSDEERTTGNPQEALQRNRTRVYREMHQELVVERELYKKPYFDKLFLEIEAQYSARLSDYLECSDPTWDELAEKWNTFSESAAGIKPTWDRLETVVESRWTKLRKSPSQRAGNYWGGFLDVKLNGLDPEKTLTDIAQEIAGKSPGGLAPYLDVLNSNDVEKNRYETEETRLQRYARYEALYRAGSDDVVAALGSRLAELNKTIKETFPVFEGVHQCVADVAAKQCSN